MCVPYWQVSVFSHWDSFNLLAVTSHRVLTSARSWWKGKESLSEGFVLRRDTSFCPTFHWPELLRLYHLTAREIGKYSTAVFWGKERRNWFEGWDFFQYRLIVILIFSLSYFKDMDPLSFDFNFCFYKNKLSVCHPFKDHLPFGSTLFKVCSFSLEFCQFIKISLGEDLCLPVQLKFNCIPEY